MEEKGSQEFQLTLVGENLKISKPKEAWGHTTHDRPGLGCGVSVIEPISNDLFTGEDQTQSSSRRYPQARHGFAHHVFS
jgi:hypothetical protein